MKWLSVKKPLTLNDIEKIERDLSVCLPVDYKRLIGPINGGALKDAYVNVPGLGSVPYSRNVSLSKDSPANIYLLLPAVNDKAIRYFPFAGVGNGDYFCFDLLNDCVVLRMHETIRVFPVCRSFSELINHIQS